MSKTKITFVWIRIDFLHNSRNYGESEFVKGDHPLSLSIFFWSIVNKYREGKVKKTPT